MINLALVFGTLAMACWMLGGAVAVFGTTELYRHHWQQMSDFVSLGFNIAGAACAIAMISFIIAA
ncbi:hypothetical protein JNB88_27405 [Rhizobium cauense]|uniref:hypothetical protein n=1 Tax=Rhizobium cauense TaxID=1166683 RepID=UPI001C6E5050|nr:hypothetical protein [Rhizobium cauense]MBW9117351.1 hypothetical protein [Rhizobium cauense]